MFKTQMRIAIHREKQLYLKLHVKASWRVNLITQHQINSTVLSKRKLGERWKGSTQQPGACGAATSLASLLGTLLKVWPAGSWAFPESWQHRCPSTTVRVPQRSASSTHSLSWCPATLAQAKMGVGEWGSWVLTHSPSASKVSEILSHPSSQTANWEAQQASPFTFFGHLRD